MEDNCFFDLNKVNPNELSPAVWAYIGDAVYELFVRNQLVSKGPSKTRHLHYEAVARVRASYQAELLMKLEPQLLETELAILKRGRNVKSGHVPASSDLATYKHSTAFEALIGYLYLSGQKERLVELLNATIDPNGGISEC